MNLAAKLREREAAGRPVRVALIGAGKFGTMILAQMRLTPGVRLDVLADLDASRALSAAERAGWPRERFATETTSNAAADIARSGRTAIVPDGVIAAEADVDVVIEATGHQSAGALHALRAIDAGHHVAMVTVEADVVVGPILAERARRRGVVYSLAYGDQPAIICELVDWARTCGLDVVAAGKGTKFLPEYRRSTPDTAFGYYGFTPEEVAAGDFNAKMFNSFLDGTKSAIEMVAVANATGLDVPEAGLSFAPVPADRLASVLVPKADGGILERAGVADVVSCVDLDGTFLPNHLRWGVYVVFTSQSAYARRCFTEYGMATDPSGRYAALWRPYHLIGLELGVTVASVALRGEPTGAPATPRADVVCAPRRAMRAGETIDGEGGYAVYGGVASAERARSERLLPMGLAHGVRLVRDVAADEPVCYDDVEVDRTSPLARLREEQDAHFGILATR